MLLVQVVSGAVQDCADGRAWTGDGCGLRALATPSHSLPRRNSECRAVVGPANPSFKACLASPDCGSQHGWTITDGVIVFPNNAVANGAGARGPLPSLELINNALVYAKELERIV